MGALIWRLGLFSLSLLFTSGLTTATILRDEGHQEISYQFNTQLDSVPIVNPTTPGTASPYPTLNPTTPQSPYTTRQSPPIPTTTSPPTYMTPTNPTTSPNTNPNNSPSTTPTTMQTSPNTNTNPTTPTSPAISGGQWCIASASAQDKALKVALDYACGYGADCSAIQPGASCYNPNTLKDHASYAFNDYYQKNPAPTSCSFGGTATLTNKDPSNGNCHYSSSKSSSMSPPTSTYESPPNGMMSPTTAGGSTMTPTAPGGTTMTPSTPSMTIPDGASVYGPTGSPNKATPLSQSFMLLFVTVYGSQCAIHLM
ncbi:hypothetical protein HN51_036302 [Arachis hypogaea]|uniref:glucan endo-1,3-beta-glucosidase 12 n=1 Tax=Arachis ipaensis TaxID=130454 RepID=UPI0007AF00AA|nr:glucan endo-1,3-beta-glucosidase 12 [Arachis ipaensis]XP_025636722.1 glucan endo-1,3-beta-glucosidase 12 [Arachis hypogaea]QHO01632.1 Glucan endo-1,3-beta-glucosidase [Arachis hypogaea]